MPKYEVLLHSIRPPAGPIKCVDLTGNYLFRGGRPDRVAAKDLATARDNECNPLHLKALGVRAQATVATDWDRYHATVRSSPL